MRHNDYFARKSVGVQYFEAAEYTYSVVYMHGKISALKVGEVLFLAFCGGFCVVIWSRFGNSVGVGSVYIVVETGFGKFKNGDNSALGFFYPEASAYVACGKSYFAVGGKVFTAPLAQLINISLLAQDAEQ